MRWHAARRLEDIGPKAASAARPCSRRIKDENATVREHPARALGMLGDKQSSVINGLASLITDSDAQVRGDRSDCTARTRTGRGDPTDGQSG